MYIWFVLGQSEIRFTFLAYMYIYIECEVKYKWIYNISIDIKSYIGHVQSYLDINCTRA